MVHPIALVVLAVLPGQGVYSFPTAHTQRDVEGWTVHIDDRLLDGPHKALGDRALRILANRLYDIQLVVPADKTARLRKVSIWLDFSHGKLHAAQYHPSAAWLIVHGYSAALARCVHIPDAAEFASTELQRTQPWCVLHELAHAYHDQVLGFDHPAIRAAWQRFRASGKYEKTLHISGDKIRHYGLTDPREFFAEMTETYFGHNDFYPFNRAELQHEEPAVFELLATLWGTEGGYPCPDLLIEPAQLAKPEGTRQYVILDAREHSKYEVGHVPGARWADHGAWAKAFGHGKDRQGWSKRIGEMGIAADSRVVVYDDSSGKDAARIWWILRYWGVQDVRLLNGGWPAWKREGGPSENHLVNPAPVTFVARARAERLATKEQLLKTLEGNKPQIVDARSEKEFCGVEKLANKRAGAIPGARHLEWSDLIDKQTQRFKSAADLRKLFDQAGIDLDRPTATYCQSGGRASVMAFGLELMGAKDVTNYYPSWNEWGNAEDTPVVPGKAREKK
jgi:3-mercaptopyruvate sulfurtransferase SseA